MTADLHTLLDTDPAAGLRGVAKLMRSRAEAATPGPWSNRRGPGEHVVAQRESIATLNSLRPREDRRHIAAADPPFVLAVADWLDWEARCAVVPSHSVRALATARAYLGDR